MKKAIGIIVLLAVVAGSVALYMFFKDKKEEAAIATVEEVVGDTAQYLPADSVFFLSVDKLETMTTELPKSPVGRLFSKEVALAFMKEAGAPEVDQRRYVQILDKITAFFTNPSFQQLFGDSLTIAVLPLDLDDIATTGNRDVGTAMDRYIVAIGSAVSPVNVQTFRSLNPDLTVTEEKINDLSVFKIALPDAESAFYAHIDGNHVLLAANTEAIEVCLGAKTGGNLKGNAHFVKAEQGWAAYPPEKSFFRAFMNIESLLGTMDRVKDQKTAEALSQPDVKLILDLYRGFEYLSGVVYTTNQSVDCATMLSFAPEKLNPMMKELFLKTDGKNTSLNLLTSQPLFYLWGTPLNLRFLFDTFKTDPQMAATLEMFCLQWVGLDTDELAATLGPQYGFALDDIVDAGLFPLPKMSLWFGIRDAKNAEKVLNYVKEMTATLGNKPNEEQVAGSAMVNWLLLPGDAGQPAMALQKDTLFLTSSTNLMKSILTNKADVSKVPQTTRDKLGAVLSDKIESANSSVFILYPSRFTTPILNLIDFGNHTKGGSMPVQTVKQELGAFLNSMDYMAGYCNIGDKSANCDSTIKWAQ